MKNATKTPKMENSFKLGTWNLCLGLANKKDLVSETITSYKLKCKKNVFNELKLTQIDNINSLVLSLYLEFVSRTW